MRCDQPTDGQVAKDAGAKRRGPRRARHVPRQTPPQDEKVGHHQQVGESPGQVQLHLFLLRLMGARQVHSLEIHL